MFSKSGGCLGLGYFIELCALPNQDTFTKEDENRQGIGGKTT
jgi:hypothetical protein